MYLHFNNKRARADGLLLCFLAIGANIDRDIRACFCHTFKENACMCEMGTILMYASRFMKISSKIQGNKGGHGLNFIHHFLLFFCLNSDLLFHFNMLFD